MNDDPRDLENECCEMLELFELADRTAQRVTELMYVRDLARPLQTIVDALYDSYLSSLDEQIDPEQKKLRCLEGDHSR